MTRVFVHLGIALFPNVSATPRSGPCSHISDGKIVMQIAVRQLGEALHQLQIFVAAVKTSAGFEVLGFYYQSITLPATNRVPQPFAVAVRAVFSI